MKSKLKPENFDVPALTSLKIRHLLNNIGEIGTNYLECGVHKGGTFTSSVSGNDNLKHITAIDSFESDAINQDKAQPQFVSNALKFLPVNSSYKLIVSDSFRVDISEIPNGVDIYLYDGDHSRESQEKALTYYYPVLADEFIFMVDDYDWSEVQEGTQSAIKKVKCDIIFQKYIPSIGSHNNDNWWNGFYIALLKKNNE